MLAALFVDRNGVYANIPHVDVWDVSRDARLYYLDMPVVAHPPCERWGRFYRGSPLNPIHKLGDDDGCFLAALHAVRRYGGVLEHPAHTKAFKMFSMPIPRRGAGWTEADPYGGRAVCVSQGHYGHKADKETWLYACHTKFPELVHGKYPNPTHVVSTSRGRFKRGLLPTISKRERRTTPIPFRDLLLSIAASSLQ